MEMLIAVGVGAVALMFSFISGLVIVAKFRIVPEADQAVVITGSTVTRKDAAGESHQRPKVVVGGGAFVIPIWNKYQMVSLEVVQIPIKWEGLGATLPSKDRIPVVLEGELTVQVDGDNEDQIVLASQKLGIPNRGTAKGDEFNMANSVKQKADKLVAAALRTAVFEFNFVDLNAQKEMFENRVQELLQKDLARLGLTLTAVSIPQVSQGNFGAADGDMFDEEGKRKVAEIIEAAKTQKNDIEQTNKIARQQRDFEARQQQLEIEFKQKKKEADNVRQVDEYQAMQKAETAKNVLLQEQSEAEARAAQERAIKEAQAIATEKAEKAEIAKIEAVSVRQSEARAAQREATETAAIREAQADASRMVAEEEAHQKKETAEIAKNKAVEAARIEKEMAIKVADEQRQQAIEEAAVAREIAVATKRADEAAARADQATAEAKQKGAEEQVITVKAEAEAERQKRIVTIKAEEEASKDRIDADKSAYVEAKRAEGERDAAEKRAQATKAVAEGQAHAVTAKATGDAEAVRLSAAAYAEDLTVRAQAEFEAAEKQAQARKKLAAASLEEGKATAESRRLKVEAENKIAPALVVRDVAIAAIEKAPEVIRELMYPVAQIPADVKILQVNGLGENGDVDGLPATILNTGLAAAGIAPFLREATKAIADNPDIAEMTGVLGTAAKGALTEAVKTVREATPENGA